MDAKAETLRVSLLRAAENLRNRPAGLRGPFNVGTDAELDVMISALATPEGGAAATPTATPLEDWHEDDGDVLWWRFPVEEFPWVGSPIGSDWPGYHTHWTPLPAVPTEPPHIEGSGHG